MEQMADKRNLGAEVKDKRRANADEESSTRARGVDCAGMVLNCLFCQFCDLFHMLPDSCARLVNHCCPNYKHIITTIESTPSNEDDVCDLDCGLFSCCHDAGDCLELAMEVSQLCYH
ncbi:myoD family inhibitor domain-containing protein 2 [Gouania willdenowi]|uniref:myoD family inhibitor domain-containing protein 2 n=1 Tax=Gouania willdenowi TaxID=441366 RepID=UPI001056A07D|nr:myoD family inhibitor domain-containing protein 2 [Gouania willdenowi]